MGSAIKTCGAVVYTRVSTNEQAENGTSLEAQRRSCRQKAESLGLPIIAEYEDAGISGGLLLSRYGMMAAIEDLKAGRVDTLICANISRFSRDAEHQQLLLKSVRAAGGRLVFCDFDYQDTPEGDLFFGIAGNFAAYERQVIRARTLNGRRRRVESGLQTQRSVSPFGYHIVTKADVLRGDYPADQIGRYVIIDNQAQIVRRLFASYSAGTHSLPLLARELNQEEIPTPQGGTCWRASTLKAILTNPAYKGSPAYGRRRNATDESRLLERHKITGEALRSPRYSRAVPESDWVYLEAPAIVDTATWSAVQDRLSSNQTRRGGNPKRARMLSGRIFCPECGGSMQVEPRNRGRTYYICSRHRRTRDLLGEPECISSLYDIAIAEQAVMTAVEYAYQRPESLQAALAVYNERASSSTRTGGVRKEIASIDALLLQLAEQEKAAVTAQIQGIMAGASTDAYAAVFSDIATKRKDLENRRGELSRILRPSQEKRTSNDTKTNTGQLLADAQRVIRSEILSGAQKRDVIGTVIERAVCQKGGADVQFVEELFDQETLQCIPMQQAITRQTPFDRSLEEGFRPAAPEAGLGHGKLRIFRFTNATNHCYVRYTTPERALIAKSPSLSLKL